MKVVNTFHQDYPKQGLPKTTQVKISVDKKYSETEYEYSTVVPDAALLKVSIVQQTSITNKIYDGQETSLDRKKTFTYDEQGNLTATEDLGFVTSSEPDLKTSDNVREEYAYSNLDTTSIYMTRIANKKTKRANRNGELVLDNNTNYSYDGLGRLIKVESQVNDETPAKYVSSSMTYDTWGNVLTTKDPSGITTMEVEYDANYHNLVTKTTDAQGLANTVEYSNTLLPSITRDHQGNETKIFYDVFGRVTKQVSPLGRDSETAPTIQTIYQNFTEYEPQDYGEEYLVFPFSELTIEKTNSTDKLVSITYYDGLGRPLESKIQTKIDGEFVTIDRYYDSAGRLKALSNPYITTTATFDYNNYLLPSSLNKTTSYEYDPIGRLIKTTGPDGSVSQTIYNKNITTSVDPLGHKSEVENRINISISRTFTGSNGSHTQYSQTTQRSYRGMTEIEDNSGNLITTKLDMLGRKTEYTDPDMGTWSYTYTDNGSLESQTDARGNTLSFLYDTMGRLTDKRLNGNVIANYEYGTLGYQNGQLGRLTQGENSQSLTYDKLGRPVTISKSIGNLGIRSITMSYDINGRLATKILPGGGVLTLHQQRWMILDNGVPKPLEMERKQVMNLILSPFGLIA